MEGKYQAYPEYRDSGVEWLGNVPSHWSSQQLKHLCTYNDEVLGESVNSEYELEYVDIGSVSASGGIKATEIMTFGKAPSRARRVVRDGDVIVSTVRTYLEAIAPIDNPPSNLVVSTGFAVVRPNKFLHKGYASYCLRTSGFIKEVVARSVGVSYPAINATDLVNIKAPTPAFDEQQTIANFLDHETARIDTLIEKQQQLIKLLKEKRQAVISHAITKGLSPNVPMRDSGVEWLGEVPEHWVVKRLKHVSPKVGVGLVINPSTYTRDEGVYFIFGGDVKEYKFDLSKTRRIAPKDSDGLLPSRLNHRDLVSVRVGYPGITAVVTEELEGANCASVIVIRRGKYNSDWLCAAMNVWVGRQQVDLVSYGAAQKQFNVADAVEFIFPVPPENEQDEIATFVEDTLNCFNTLSEKTDKQIKLLKERRTALISAAVTGKIDVRNWQAPQQKQNKREAAA